MDVVEAIKRQIDLAEYIGRVTHLQKSGRSFKGLCPFHTEKTPSFYVFPERGTWRCFGSCGEGGDLFSFVQKRENVEFRDALRLLAAEAGIQLSAEDGRRRSHAERLSALMSAAVDHYERCLDAEEGQAAREYLVQKRGLAADTIKAWHIGWAPDGWRGLRDFLRNRGYEDRDMIDAGLLVEGEDGREPYDRFRGRVIIPIANERGEFVAMGGRGLHGEEPKYLNSPQTDLFDKGRTLFGLEHNAAGIRETGTVVVVEGYMDVIGPWQAGFRNVVATMGTSLTEAHARLLRRFARRVVLAMDPDAAGLAAAERAGGLFLGLDTPERMAQAARSADAIAGAADMDLRVAPLPPGKDPDEIARDAPDTWRGAIDQALPFAEFLLRRIMGPERPQSPMEARAVVDRLRPVLVAVRDPVERAMYVQRVARHLGVSEEAVLERIRASTPGRFARPAQRPAEAPVTAEDVLLAILLRYPHLRHQFRSYPESLFSGAVGREIFRRWLHQEDFAQAPEDDPIGTRARMLATRRLPPLSDAEARMAADEKVRDILRDRIIQHQAARAEELADAERVLGANRLAELALEAWRGEIPGDEERELAEALIEELQLGLSIHRREVPRG
ncbi:MAG TPA: DNA primase [Tepidiformaceae bacterium]|nr:DNA primase [Tepidiformaceae bacterium]